MTSPTIPVLIRVYNRIDDLVHNVQIIESRWNKGNWKIFIAFNGQGSGFKLPSEITAKHTIINIPENNGHKKGAWQLLKQGLQGIPDEYEYVVTLEADTWVLNDDVPLKYLDKMRADKDVVWCAANWVDKQQSVAMDFAVVNCSFIRRRIEIVDIRNEVSLECRIASDITKLGNKYLPISECQPTHIPKAMPFRFQTWGRRRRIFPRTPMLTHHIEDLTGGMQTKESYALLLTGGTSSVKGIIFRTSLLLYEYLIHFIPKSRWFKGRRFKY